MALFSNTLHLCPSRVVDVAPLDGLAHAGVTALGLELGGVDAHHQHLLVGLKEEREGKGVRII